MPEAVTTFRGKEWRPHFQIAGRKLIKEKNVKVLTAAILIGLLLSTSVTVISSGLSMTDRCACSPGVKCPEGYIAVCSKRECHASCINKDPNRKKELLTTPVTLKISSTGEKLASELARSSNRKIVLLSSKPDDMLNLDIKNAPLWDVLDALSESGKVQLDGEDFSSLKGLRNALATGEKVSVCIHRASVQSVIDELMSLSGQPLHITAGDSKTLVSLAIEGATMREIVAQLSAHARVRIATN
jgi:hypothetical protein